MSSADIAAELTNVRGTGCWSAAIFLMFHLHRLDVWPTGCFSVRAGYPPPGESRSPHPKHSTGRRPVPALPQHRRLLHLQSLGRPGSVRDRHCEGGQLTSAHS
jgi:hypothetical protein